MDELQRQLEAFSKRYGTQGYLMKARIEILMKQGRSPEDAVRQVFREFGVEDWLQVNVAQVIVGTAQDALGKEAASTLSTAAILEALSNPWDGSGLTLSEKIHGASNVMLNDVISTLREQIRRNKTVKDTAQALYDGYKSGHVVWEQQLPQYLNELTRWTRRSRENLPQEELKDLQRSIRKVRYQADDMVDDRSTYNHFRTSLRELMDKLEHGSEKAAQRALQNAIQEKSRYVAERIARTEGARARYDAFMARNGEDEDVVAYKWKLGSRHPAEDICDMYANADLYGLGKGIFPKDKVVPQPAHPHCLCHYAPVYWGEIDEKKRSDNVEENGRAWLAKQPLHIRQAILGVKGEQEWKAGRVGWMEKARNLSDMFSQTDSRLSYIIERSRKTKVANRMVNWDVVRSEKYKHIFQEFPLDSKINRRIHEKALKMLKHHDGDEYEDLYLINALTGKIEGASLHPIEPLATSYTKEIYDALKRDPQNYISMHNHPNSVPPTGSDIASASRYKFGIVCCHNGIVYMYKPSKKVISQSLFDMTIEKYRRIGYTEIESGEKALEQFEKTHGLKWRKWSP